MILSSTESADDGFATAAAVLVSLGLAVLASALTTTAIGELKSASSNLERAQNEETLSGAQQSALITMHGANSSSRLRWSLVVDGQYVSVLAEAEGSKVSLSNFVKLQDSDLSKFHLAQTALLKAKLQALSVTQALGPDLEAAAPSPIWRTCVRSLISAYGSAAKLQLAPATAPGATAAIPRAGEMWRIRASLSSGWTDDRIVRLSGDFLHPGSVVARRFSKNNEATNQCDAMFKPES